MSDALPALVGRWPDDARRRRAQRLLTEGVRQSQQTRDSVIGVPSWINAKAPTAWPF